MCGIAGYLGTIPPSDEAIGGALQTMKQRGPDHQGALRINLCDGSQAVLLSSRLSIVDLEARSNMPFQRDGWTIVFNGEIYNHEALRLELMREGVRFITSSDTEVLVAGLARFGQAFLDRAEGMWAFAAFDHDRQELMLCRDRFGEKPLFTYKTAHGFFFASEHKTIAALSTTQLVPNKRQVLRYLVNGYRSLHKSDETWHNGVLAFPPRTCRVTGVGGNVKSHRYWQLQAARVNIDEFEAVEHLKRLLPEAVRLRLRADVPIACCLSGGVDSTSLASLAVKAIGVKLHGFSIVDRNPHYDERENIEAVVKDLNCQSTFIEIPNEPLIRHQSLLLRL